MKTFEQMGIRIPEILLPKNLDVSTWSVVACDQYTQDREYWASAEKIVDGKPSTLNIILPEVYLNDSGKKERIQKIRSTMKEYLESGIFSEPQKEFVYIERTTAYGRVRRGLVAALDLETYEWKPFSKALVRATEATIVDRIPPRMEIRRGAPLELPHIMLLVNDPEKTLVEGIGSCVSKKNPIYSGSLMQNSGSIKGWAVSSAEEIECVRSALEKLSEKNASSDGSVFLFAVGDGNHSLATAKAVWDEYKSENPEKAADKNCPIRYALVEIVNIYDSGLTFEPIHRVVFNGDGQNKDNFSRKIIEKIAEKLGGTVKNAGSAEELENAVKKSCADFGFVFNADGKQEFILVQTKITELAVASFQPVLDEILKNDFESASIDYIHGAQEVFRLGAKENTLGILLPPVAKDSFFATINSHGPLPRKSFSMGEADEKRFYLECRRLFPDS